jgi:formate hydrogenlyase subunit 6/NADH:ubiquinone oxidoreductase subunit I
MYIIQEEEDQQAREQGDPEDAVQCHLLLCILCILCILLCVVLLLVSKDFLPQELHEEDSIDCPSLPATKRSSSQQQRYPRHRIQGYRIQLLELD